MNEVNKLQERAWPLPTFTSTQIRQLLDKRLLAPAAEFLSRPSKGMRGRLVLRGFELVSNPARSPTVNEQLALEKLSAAMEMIHAGSLILDDIQDQSDLRRGRPAFHVQHGAPAAIAVGSWLLAWPQQIIAGLPLSPGARQQLNELVLNTIAEAHYGQIIDVTTQVASLACEDIAPVADFVALSKTGYLTACALAAGAMVAGCSETEKLVIQQLGEALGVLLQRLDDLGNFLTPRVGRKRYEDLLNGRVTWVWAWLAQEHPEQRDAMQAAVARLPQDSEAVLAIASELDLCRRAKDEAHRQFAKALADRQMQVDERLLRELRQMAEELTAAFL